MALARREPEKQKRQRAFRRILWAVAVVVFVGLILYVLIVSIFIVRGWDMSNVLTYFLLMYSVLASIALPVISYRWAYYVYYPASLFGLWMSLLFWLNRFGQVESYSSFAVALLLALVILQPIHYVTRRGFVFFRRIFGLVVALDLRTISRIGMSMGGPLLIVANAVFSSPGVLEQNIASAIILVSFMLLLYVAFSI